MAMQVMSKFLLKHTI